MPGAPDGAACGAHVTKELLNFLLRYTKGNRGGPSAMLKNLQKLSAAAGSGEKACKQSWKLFCQEKKSAGSFGGRGAGFKNPQKGSANQ